MSDILTQADQGFQKALEHLRSEFSRLQIGRASAALVEHINVEAYGMSQPLKAVASVSIPDSRTIQIQCWDKGVMHDVEKAIQVSGIGLNPINDGIYIRLNIPQLTEERRKELVKVVYRYAEEAKIGIRNERQQAMNKLDGLKKDKTMPEDEFHGEVKKLQDTVDQFNKMIDEAAKKKEADVMTI